MMRNLNSEEALAHGALACGIGLAVGYPGSPSAVVMNTIFSSSTEDSVHAEWSTNEKVSLEIAIGASLGGTRAVVCVKSVGMNVLLDPLMALNLTGVHAGLVIVLGDDPGAYGSQNDQDTRPLASFAEIPMMEPSTPAESYAMMTEAYRVSEEYSTVVIVRITRSCSQRSDEIDIDPAGSVHAHGRGRHGPDETPLRWVPYPGNAVEKHRLLHEKLDILQAWSDKSEFNKSEGRGEFGVIAAGFAYAKLSEVLPGAPGVIRVLKLGTLYPMPQEPVAEFLRSCREVLVLEENEPYLETQIKAVAHDQEIDVLIRGKRSGHVPGEGELFRWQIREALERFHPGLPTDNRYSKDRQAEEQPGRESYCAGCPYPEIVDTLIEAGKERGLELLLSADPGCLATVAPLLHNKFAIGSAVGVAQGLQRAGVSGNKKPVAIFGDSSFFHTSLPSILNAAYNQTPILMVVLDNSATVTTGFQPNPGTGKNARGKEAPQLSIEKIAAVCGVPEQNIRTIPQEAELDEMKTVFHEALAFVGLGLVVVRKLCEKPTL